MRQDTSVYVLLYMFDGGESDVTGCAASFAAVSRRLGFRPHRNLTEADMV